MSLPVLELDDIQSGALRPRPTPFAATYIILRIDEPAAGRDLPPTRGGRGATPG